MVRNREMADCADALLVVRRMEAPETKGTASMIREAKRYGLKRVIVEVSGQQSARTYTFKG